MEGVATKIMPLDKAKWQSRRRLRWNNCVKKLVPKAVMSQFLIIIALCNTKSIAHPSHFETPGRQILVKHVSFCNKKNCRNLGGWFNKQLARIRMKAFQWNHLELIFGPEESLRFAGFQTRWLKLGLFLLVLGNQCLANGTNGVAFTPWLPYMWLCT